MSNVPWHILKNQLKTYGPCSICGNDDPEELNFEARIHHNSVVRCFDLKACGRRSRKRQK